MRQTDSYHGWGGTDFDLLLASESNDLDATALLFFAPSVALKAGKLQC